MDSTPLEWSFLHDDGHHHMHLMQECSKQIWTSFWNTTLLSPWIHIVYRETINLKMLVVCSTNGHSYCTWQGGRGWWNCCWAELGNLTLPLLRLRRMIQNDEINFVILFCENNSNLPISYFFINQNLSSPQNILEEVIRRNSNNVKGTVLTFSSPPKIIYQWIFYKKANSIYKLVDIRFSL